MSRLLALFGPWLRWTLWAVALAAWTVLLLTPEPVQVAEEVLPEEAVFPIAKTVHVTVYAILTLLTAWLPARGSVRVCLLVALAAHAPLTEWLQRFVPGRTGTVRDVLLDLLGVAVGVALTWRCWRVVQRHPRTPH